MAEWHWPDSLITNVVDGDTIDALVTRDLGFGGKVIFPVRLRLNRINTPQVTSEAGQRARNRVVELVADEAVHVTTLKPYKYGGPATSSGQYMAEVTLAPGANLSDLLVAEDLAVYWSGQGARPSDGLSFPSDDE